ncbi:MAG TPA: hypothetical protein VK922_07320, partial [Gemmatimonadaceae bacterium]|nr:hypothetical protein [Gemmatimonadaceae bacterium]
DIARQHVEDKPPRPRSLNAAISPELEGIILRCLAKDREERFATGEELSEALSILAPHTTDPSVARTLQVPRITPTSGVSTWSRVSNSPWVRRGVLALGFSAVVIALAFAVAGDPARPGQNAVADTTLSRDSLQGPPTLPGVNAPLPDSPSAEPQSSPTLATLRIVAPDSARIVLDDASRGTGTVRLTNIVPGAHVVTASLPNAEGCESASATRRVTLTAGGTETAQFQLRRCGTLALLRVLPANAAYVIESRDGPSRRGAVVDGTAFIQLPPGSYQVRLYAEDCSDYSAPVAIEEGQRKELFPRLICESSVPAR